MKKNNYNFWFKYQKFILENKLLYYFVHISEAFILALLIAKLVLKLDDANTFVFILVPVLLTPVGIYLVGGYKKIKRSFMKRYSLKDSDFV